MNDPDPMLTRLARLIHLQSRARKLAGHELRFLIVNETITITPYQQAVLWENKPDGLRITAVSGAALPDPNAPYLVWLNALYPSLKGNEPTLRVITSSDVPQNLRAKWAEFFPPYALFCPLQTADGQILGALVFTRAEPWDEIDTQIIRVLAESYSTFLQVQILLPAVKKSGWLIPPSKKKMTTRIAAILFLCSLLPVHQSVLAPAEVVSESPSYLRAPFEGVVDAIHISPGNAVHKGDVLASLDTKQLQAKYDVALRSLDIARAEYTEASQQALSDGKAKSHLPLLQSKIDQQEAEKAYLTSLLDHATLIAPSDGVAVFDDAYNLVGKPVVVGERIMVIASPQNTSLEIQVPATGMTAFTDDAPVDFFSNIEPSHAIHAHLTYTSYASALTAEGVLSYRLIAHLEEGQPSLRLGLKGTAKVYGHDRPLIMWLLRRPFALVRQWIFL